MIPYVEIWFTLRNMISYVDIWTLDLTRNENGTNKPPKISQCKEDYGTSIYFSFGFDFEATYEKLSSK